METRPGVEYATPPASDGLPDLAAAAPAGVRRVMLSDPESLRAASLEEPVRVRRVSVEWRRSVDLAAGRRRPV